MTSRMQTREEQKERAEETVRSSRTFCSKYPCLPFIKLDMGSTLGAIYSSLLPISHNATVDNISRNTQKLPGTVRGVPKPERY